MFHRLHSMVQAKLNETISIFSFYYNKVQKKDAKKPKKRQIEEVQMAKKKVQKFGWLEGERRVQNSQNAFGELKIFKFEYLQK